MKSNVLNASLFFGSVLLATSCSNIDGKPHNSTEATAEAFTETTTETAKEVPAETREVVFQQGKLIEVAFLSIKEGKENQLQNEYFPEVMPIVAEYGGKPLMDIGVKNAWSEDIKPQMVVFFEWPSAEKKEAFEKDPRFLEAKKIRDDALSFLRLGFFEVDKDMPVKLDGSKFYEIYGCRSTKTTVI